MTATGLPSLAPHVITGPVRGRVLAALAWAGRRAAVVAGAVLVAQMLRADVYPAVTVLLVLVAAGAAVGLLVLAAGLDTRAWWCVPGLVRPAAPPPRWQVVTSLGDAVLLVTAAVVLTSPVTGTRYPGVPVTGALIGFAAAYAVRSLVRGRARPAAATALVVRGAALVAAATVASAARSPWSAEQLTSGATAGAVAFVLVTLVARRAGAGPAGATTPRGAART